MAELYGAANQDSGVSSYISAASPAPSTGFGHSLGVSGQALRPRLTPFLLGDLLNWGRERPRLSWGGDGA